MKHIGTAAMDRIHHHQGIRRKGRPVPAEESPTQEKMRPRGQWVEHSSRYYTMIRRFLTSRIGQPWDDVFSEICEKTRSKSQHELRDAFLREVEIRTFLQEGKPYYHNPYYRSYSPYPREAPIAEGTFDGFYLCPATRTLQHVARVSQASWKEQEKAKVAERRREGKTSSTQYHKLDGIWYEVTLELAVSYMETTSMFRSDIILGARRTTDQVRHLYGKPALAKKKRQLGHRDLKHLGLVNEPNVKK